MFSLHIESNQIRLSFLSAVCWLFISLLGATVFSFSVSLFLTVGSILLFANLATQPYHLVRILLLGSMSLLLIVNATFALSNGINIFVFNRNMDFFYQASQISQPAYHLAMSYVSAFAGMLAIVSRFKFLKIVEKQLLELFLEFRNPNKLTVWIGAIGSGGFLFYLFYTGSIVYRGTKLGDAEAGVVSALAPILSFSVSFGMVCGAVLIASKFADFKLPKVFNVLFGFIFLLAVGFAITQSRRDIVVSLVLVYFLVAFFRGNISIKFNVVFALAGIFIGLPFLYIQHYMRSGSSGFHDLKTTDARETFSSAWQQMHREERVQATARESTVQNLAARPMILHPLARIMSLEYPQRTPPIWGVDFRNSFLWSIPRKIYPNKFNFAVQEGLVYERFGLYYKDTTDAIWLSSFIDFHIFGIFTHTIFLLALWFFSVKILVYMNSSTIAAAMYLGFFSAFTMSIGEGAMIGWFVLFRTVIIVLVCYLLIKSALSLFQEKRPEHSVAH